MIANSSKIKLMDPALDESTINSALISLRRNIFLNGPEVAEFESDFAEYVGSKYSVSTNSGTSALVISLLSIGVKRNDLVIVPSASFIATANAVVMAGAKPIFADIKQEDYNLDPNSVETLLKKYGSRIKAIMPVHLYGRPADLNSLKKLGEEYQVNIIDDACQAHGAEYHGKMIGSRTLASSFSFYPSKNMTVGGDGGMITTNSKEIYEIANSIKNSGRAINSHYEHVRFGFTARLSSVLAAIGIKQLKLLPKRVEARRHNAKIYLDELGNLEGILMPTKDSQNVKSAWHQFVISIRSRDKLSAYLNKNGIETGIHYPIPIHKQVIYLSSSSKFKTKLTVTETWAKSVLSIPVHHALKDDDILFISSKLKEFYKSNGGF